MTSDARLTEMEQRALTIARVSSERNPKTPNVCAHKLDVNAINVGRREKRFLYCDFVFLSESDFDMSDVQRC